MMDIDDEELEFNTNDKFSVLQKFW